jgi:hypothetical protein
MTDSEQYIPGVCNIGGNEVAKRRIMGWIGLAACVVLWAAFIVLKAAAVWRLVLFVPALLAALGFLQATRRVCVIYGLSGTYKVGSGGKRRLVELADDRRQDRRTSLRIIGYSMLIALAVTAVAYCVL